MAGTISFGNLSGIDTASLVDSLMSLERTTQNRIKTNITSRESVLKALQTLSTGVSSLSTKAGELKKPAAWDLFAVTSTKDSVKATGSTGAATGSFSFDVVKTAASHKVLYSGAVAASTDVVDPDEGKLTFTRPTGDPIEVVAVPPTLQGVIKAINGTEGLDVRATAVDMGDGKLRLQLTSARSGADAAFTVTGFDAVMGTGTVATAGRDAVIQIGPDPATDQIRSSSNTFATAFPGVSFTVSKEETGVVLDVAADSKGATDQMKGLVDLVNSTMSAIRTQSSYTPASGSATKGTAGPLAGDLGVRKVGNDLRQSIFPGGNESLADIGLELTQGGSFKLNETKFSKAMADDPEGTRAKAAAFAGRVATVTEPALDKTKGFLARAISSEQSAIRDLNDRVAEWDVRLDLRRTKLEKQFTAMSVALGSLSSQQNYMGSQLANLNKS